MREVNHFWFKQWPDYGIPETGIPIITLLLDSRAYAKNSQSPVVMHCSSGNVLFITVQFLQSIRNIQTYIFVYSKKL